MENYELLLIIDPSLSETERDSSLANLRTLFEKAKAQIEKEDIW
jgi:ribosomal protein S6